MAISMKSMVLLVFCSAILRQSYVEAYIPEDLCKTIKPLYTEFRVKHAIRVGDYIGVTGELSKPDFITKRTVTIRVHYWHQPDVSGKTKYQYFSATLWPDLDSEIKSLHPYYVMSVRNVNVLEDRSTYETILLVGNTENQNRNKTTALTFDYMNVQNLGNGTDEVKTIDKKKLIYDALDGIDNSQAFSLKFFLAHFPDLIEIKAVFTFEVKQNGNQDFTHFAIVYTKEEFQGKQYYFRQYMRSENKDYENSQSFLDWDFDKNQKYCSALDKAPPDAVVFIRKETSGDNQIIYFAEFYGKSHQLLKLTYNTEGDYSLVELGPMVPNFEAFLHCDTHPVFLKVVKSLCKVEDYNNPDDEFGVGDEETSGNLMHWIAILTTIAAIVGLIAIVIYSFVANQQKDPN